MFELNEGFPYFSFFKDENFDNFSIRYKKLIKVVMSDDISKPVVDTNEENRSLIRLFVYHLGYNKYIKNYIKLKISTNRSWSYFLTNLNNIIKSSTIILNQKWSDPTQKYCELDTYFIAIKVDYKKMQFY